jgi:hypothetical protein
MGCDIRTNVQLLLILKTNEQEMQMFFGNKLVFFVLVKNLQYCDSFTINVSALHQIVCLYHSGLQCIANKNSHTPYTHII